MKKAFVFLFVGVASLSSMAGKIEFNKNIKTALYTRLYAGASASFGVGNYVNYQKQFFNVSSPNTSIKGSILPNGFFVLGGEERYTPFIDKLMSNLSISIGFGYQQRGFTSHYKSVYNDPSLNVTDKTVFTESYRLNEFTIPVHVRWGKKYYGEIGFGINPFISGYRWHKVAHSSSGTDAYEGGFNTKAKDRTAIVSSLFRKATLSFDMAGGIDITRMFGLRAEMQYTGRSFASGADFKTVILQIQLIINLHDKSAPVESVIPNK